MHEMNKPDTADLLLPRCNLLPTQEVVNNWHELHFWGETQHHDVDILVTLIFITACTKDSHGTSNWETLTSKLHSYSNTKCHELAATQQIREKPMLQHKRVSIVNQGHCY